MHRALTYIAAAVIFLQTGLSQEKTPAPQDKTQHPDETPRLDIPEITIVGKKAITLPFARKGEVYNVDLYAAPPPDSSLLGTPPSVSLLAGRLPRHEQRDAPWRTSAEGALGSFGTGKLRGYVDYKGGDWGVAGNAGFASSRGHVDNASFSNYDLGALAFSNVRTDNSILKSFRGEAGLAFTHKEYGMFGIPSSVVRRSHSDVALRLGMRSLNRTGGVVDLDFDTRFSTVSDNSPAIDSSASAITPEIHGMYTVPVKNVTLSAEFTYLSSSLTYHLPAQSPRVTAVDIAAAWHGGGKWRFEAGATIGGATDIAGGKESLVMPFGRAEYAIDSSGVADLWFRPQLSVTGYAREMDAIPYLSREIQLRPERAPVSFGGDFKIRGGVLTLDFSLSYSWLTSKGMIVAQNGEIGREYAEASVSAVGVHGTFRHLTIATLDFTGTLTSARESGSATQIPMMPVGKITAREEVTIAAPILVWGSFDFETPKNVDRAGVESMPTRVLVNGGVEYAIARRILLGAEIDNLFNTRYEWWKGYAAPGIGFNLTAKVNFQ